MKILLAVDGSAHALKAARRLIDLVPGFRERPYVELLTVHRPVPMLPGMSTVVSKADLERYYWEEGEQALAEAKRLLQGAGVAYEPKVLVGDPADTIARHASEGSFDLVYVGTPAKWIGSTTHKLIGRAEVPVVVVK